MRRLGAIAAGLTLLLSVSVAQAAPPFRKGPYLMDVQPDRIAVLLELDAPRAVTLEVRGGDGEIVEVASEAKAFHEIDAPGLKPASEYRYSVTVEGGGRATGRFRTAPMPGEGPIRFAVYGDSRTGDAEHAGVVRAITNARPAFLVNTGDMVATGSDEIDWHNFFTIEADLLRVMPVFPAIGNHELYQLGGGIANYKKYIRTPGGDQVPWYAFTYGPVRFVMLDSNDRWARGTAQWQFLERELEAARSDPKVEHVIVAMHHGPYSSGRHGSNELLESSGALQLMHDAGVSIVFSGHDHLYERGQVDGLKYVVTGGAGAPLYPINRRLPGQLAFVPEHHFVTVDVDGERVKMHVLRPNGSAIERCGFVAAGPWECEGARGVAAAAAVGPIVESEELWSFYARRYWHWAAAGGGLLGFVGVVVVGRRYARRRIRS